MHKRIKAVEAFKNLAAAEALSVANKRVSNILDKYTDESRIQLKLTRIFLTRVKKQSLLSN